MTLNFDDAENEKSGTTLRYQMNNIYRGIPKLTLNYAEKVINECPRRHLTITKPSKKDVQNDNWIEFPEPVRLRTLYTRQIHSDL